MTQIFRTGFGSHADKQRLHQLVVRPLADHMSRNCVSNTEPSKVRRNEMIVILQSAVDKLLNFDDGAVDSRPAWNATDSV